MKDCDKLKVAILPRFLKGLRKEPLPKFLVSVNCKFPFLLEPGRFYDLVLDHDSLIGTVGIGHLNRISLAFGDQTNKLYVSAPMLLG